MSNHRLVITGGPMDNQRSIRSSEVRRKGIRIFMEISLLSVLCLMILSIFINEYLSSESSTAYSYAIIKTAGMTKENAQSFPGLLQSNNLSSIPFSDPSPSIAEYPYHVFKISSGVKYNETPILHLDGVRSLSFTIYDENGNTLYKFVPSPFTKYYTRLLSEVYIPLKTPTVYLVAEHDASTPRFGIHGNATIGDFNMTIHQFIDSSQIRHAIATFLILLSLLLLIMALRLNLIDSRLLVVSVSWFSGLFGIWILTDLSRYSRWVLTNFSDIPPAILVFLFQLSSNFMTCAFVYMISRLFERPNIIHWIKLLFKGTLLLGITETVFDLIRFFYWNTWLDTASILAYDTTSWVITIGSLYLLVMAVIEAIHGSKRAVMLAMGLVTCLATFVISQTTDLLISHWGVVSLLISVAFIVTERYNEAHANSALYLDEIKLNAEQMRIMNMELEAAQAELLLRLGSTVDFRSKETSLHVQRVTEFTRLIASKLLKDSERVDRLSLAAALHDIGKVGIPDKVLDAPGKLTPDEFEIMKDHPRMGFEILNGSVVQILEVAAIVALTHHERYDGSGYPDGLIGDDIPIEGQIVAAADVLDALLSKRVYKDAWSMDQVMSYFKSESGRHFKPQISALVIESRKELSTIMMTLPYNDQ